ncbi:MAG: PAS domain-containing protein [Lachnospiraceae bacterium]|nr:PAS domain-containing protein [Lachnospiraceae bacterium]
MTKRIFKNTILIIFAVIVLCGVFIIGVLYKYFNKELMDEMHQEIRFIAKGVELQGMDYLEAFDGMDTRITWVASDGEVVYDNQVDITTMDNHSDRKEIKDALISSSGKSTRYSSTLSEKRVYQAQRLSDGSVIRISYVQKTIFMLIFGMIQPILILIILALGLAGFLAYRLSKQIIEPLEQIDLDNPDESVVYEEMAPFVRKIINQNSQIAQTMDILKAQQDEFKLITENMQEGFIVVDRDSKILSHNTSALRIFNAEQNVENKKVLMINRTHEFQEMVNQALSGVHIERIIPIGERIYNIYINPVFADSGENKSVAGAVIIATDVTEREQREELRREFSANVSHELKTPLTSISGIAEIIKSGIVEAKDVPEFAEKIYDEAKRLITLVEDIIKLSQLDESGLNMAKEDVNLYGLCGEVVKQLTPVAELNNVSIELEGSTAFIYGVKPVIREMIFNLCDNGIKYNKDGGSVLVSVEDTAEETLLSVKDTGIGIPIDQQDRIFERFYRVDKSHSKEIGGTGLGLSIVKHGALIHGARIKVESVPNQGTSVTIAFKN